MTWKNFGAKLGGAGLGFALGDVPGAYYGYKSAGYIENKLSENNQTMAQKRKRGGGTSFKKKAKTTFTVRPIRSGKATSSSTGGVSKLVGKMVTASNQSARSVRHKVVAKGFKGKRKPKVHVSAQLRKKVLKVFDSKMVHGSGRCLLLNEFVNVNPSLPTQQVVFPLPLPQSANVQKGVLFDPRFIMYAASRLWNGRLSEGTGLTAGAWSNVNVENYNGGSAVNYTLNWSNFTAGIDGYPSAFKVDVTELKAKITMKNNGARTMYLRMYECKPKYQRRDQNGYSDGKGFPIGDWEAALLYDAGANVKGINNAPTVASGINLQSSATGRSVSTVTMYQTPHAAASFKKQWAINEVLITLEPGQTHIHYVQGNCQTYDFSKMYTKAVDGSYEFNNIQKSDVHVFFTAVQEMSYFDGTTPLSGRLLGSSVNSNLLFETEITVRMKMPENAGTSINNVGNLTTDTATMTTMSQRKRAYYVDTFYRTGSNVNTAWNVNYDDNNPTRQTS